MKLFASVTLTLLLLCASFAAKAQQTALGKVAGFIFDQQDAIILGIDVTIENQDFRKTVMPNSDTGKYEVELPAGIYTITTKQGFWYAVNRAVFSVRANETTTINLNPTVRIATIGIEVTSQGVREPVEYNSEPKYETFLPFSDSPFNVVVEYQKRKQRKNFVEYRNAKLTYNNQSLHADFILFDKNDLRVEAKGNVTIDKNGQRQKKQNGNLQIQKVKTGK